MKPQNRWKEKKERGNLLAIRLIVFLARKLGRRVGRCLLYPITFYFVVLSRGGYKTSHNYLSHVLSVEPNFRHVFRHYYAFAATLLDMVFISAGQFDLFDIEVFDNGARQEIRNDSARGRGSILLSAHLGSFYAMRLTGEKYRIPTVAMMHKAASSKIMQVLAEQAPALKENIIEISGVDAWIKAREQLEKGVSIAILSDRSVTQGKMVEVDFLGEPAMFPSGPLLVSGILEAPVYTVFTLYRGGNRYEVYVDRFSDSIKIDRKNREQVVRSYVEQYVRILEKYCRLDPYNWFNFYDFWKGDQNHSEK